MKTTIFASILFVSVLLSTSNLIAQNPMEHKVGRGEGSNKEMHGGIPNLTEEQKTKIKDIHLALSKEVQPLRNRLGELKAKQRTLTTSDKPDMSAINANIDEITKTTNQLMKSRAAHHQQVRALLTDEQKVWFDSHPTRKGGHGHMKCDHMKCNMNQHHGKMQEKE
jgi:Spy/CpxP family protein refolding chaperone